MSHRLFILVLLLLHSPILPLANEQAIKNVRNLVNSDPQTAIESYQVLLSERPKQTIEFLGLDLLASLNNKKRYFLTIKLADLLLEETLTTKLVRGKVFDHRLNAMRKAKIWTDQKPIIDKVESTLVHLKDIHLKAKLNQSMGLLFYAQFKLADAEDYFSRALGLLEGVSNQVVADLHKQIGVSRAQTGNLVGAMESMLASLSIYDDLEKEPPASTYSNLGGLSIYLKDWPQAISYLNKAIALSDLTALSSTRQLNNLGTAYVGLEQYYSAMTTFKTSLELSEKHATKNPTAVNNIGFILRKQKKYKEALAMFELARRIHIDNNQSELVAVTYKNIGEIWLELDNRLKAADYFAKAYDIYKEKDFIPKLIELYSPMIENLEALGRHKNALILMREFKRINDEMVNVSSKATIAELKSAYDFEKKHHDLLVSEKELAKLEHDKVVYHNALLELKNAQKEQRFIQLTLISIVAVLFITGLLLFRINRYRGKANRVLKEKNSQIEIQHSKLEILNQELKKQSLHDKLTGLKNRRYLQQFIDKETARLARSYRAGRIPQQLIIIIDLDNFKSINDSYGHATGDLVIKAFANVLRMCGRESDVLARWGGEEFLWYCTDASLDEGVKLCERVRAMFDETPIEIDNNVLNVTCSLGFAPFPIWGDPKQDWDESLKIADAALYDAKNSGRNTWVGFKANLESKSNGNIELDIPQLIKDNALVRLSRG
ncbi:MAG: GGDEF domain-containing protein [Kangiellaceae bacterium]|nr:GGDEF domain-containing protein [Kangiellaceae bacterium]